MAFRSRAFLITLLALTCWYRIGYCQPKLEGRFQPLDIVSPSFDQAKKRGILWEKEVLDQPGISFFRLHFTDVVRGKADTNISIVIRDRAYKAIATISLADFTDGGEYWTGTLLGSYALLQVINDQDSPPTQFSFTVKEAGIEARGARVLSQMDPLNPKDRPVVFYRDNPKLIAASRSVAKLRYAKDGRMYSCTGFMISPDILLTNHHCISSENVCASTIAIFGYEYNEKSELQQGDEFKCQQMLDADPGLDFAILRIRGNPGVKERWGALDWDGANLRKGGQLTLIQHPDGDPKRVAHEGCAVSTLNAVGKIHADETDFGHTCDTMTGSSGSPVLSDNFKLIGLHHLGFDILEQRWARENRAVKAIRLRDRISPFLK